MARGATYQAVADRILPELDHLGAVLERLGKLAMGGRHGLSHLRRCAPRSASALDGGGVVTISSFEVVIDNLKVRKPLRRKGIFAGSKSGATRESEEIFVKTTGLTC